jgi:hypothetical protein
MLDRGDRRANLFGTFRGCKQFQRDFTASASFGSLNRCIAYSMSPKTLTAYTSARAIIVLARRSDAHVKWPAVAPTHP